MNKCTKFGADWMIFIQRSDDTLGTVTDSYNHRHISYWSFRSSGGVESPKNVVYSLRTYKSGI